MQIINDSYAAFINLDHRKDRLKVMRQDLAKAGITAERFKGLKPEDCIDKIIPRERVEVMRKRTPGAIGCHFSQVAVMLKALGQGKHAFVMEDDLIFCDDFKERMAIVDDFLKDREWDVFWLGGTYHKNPTWHKHGHSPDLPQCECTLGKDYEPTERREIVRTYGCWSTYAYIVNVKSIDKIVRMLDEKVHLSMGIDWLFILLEPQLQTFAFVPGCVRQHDGRSDIGDGTTYFSHFNKLGPHWFDSKMKFYKYGN